VTHQIWGTEDGPAIEHGINGRGSLALGHHVYKRCSDAQLHLRSFPACSLLAHPQHVHVQKRVIIGNRVFKRPIGGISKHFIHRGSSHDFHRKFQVHILSLGTQDSSRSCTFTFTLYALNVSIASHAVQHSDASRLEPLSPLTGNTR
jgi:hypothetical protein